MERYRGKVALVTGASAGMGKSIARTLAKDHGLIVVGCARRLDRLEQLAIEIDGGTKTKFHPYKCDLSKTSEIKVQLKLSA